MTGDALALGLAMLGDPGAPVCQDELCLPGEGADPTRRLENQTPRNQLDCHSTDGIQGDEHHRRAA